MGRTPFRQRAMPHGTAERETCMAVVLMMQKKGNNEDYVARMFRKMKLFTHIAKPKAIRLAGERRFRMRARAKRYPKLSPFWLCPAPTCRRL